MSYVYFDPGTCTLSNVGTFVYFSLQEYLQSEKFQSGTGALEGAEIDGFMKDMVESMQVSN